MAYTIRVNVKNGTSDTLNIVEKTCWYYANGGRWEEQDGQHVLHMGGIGTSGMLRFMSSSGDIFTVILGIHNSTPWSDVQVNLEEDATTAKLLPEYYGGGRLCKEYGMGFMSRTANLRWVGIAFHQQEGHELSAELTYYPAKDERVY